MKDPLFLASSLYLKSPQLIMALMLMMAFCLLVYATLEHRIREQLQTQGDTFPHQMGQPISPIPLRAGCSSISPVFICLC
ncbi:hypothetical protein E3U44_16575 [Nitrosococcus wardiae]|uniref:Uncharacterized protein n=1 Tax=Nitrosococcus wardiae TaxID=1814290 RepID=A0A4P7C2N1_9GAMM|nr:hypothetical protein [Nitrosococcus wardiae]QBQ55947.1 hypothetical protein E3U44_16575 [Nitrosococcus wardiae]